MGFNFVMRRKQSHGEALSVLNGGSDIWTSEIVRMSHQIDHDLHVLNQEVVWAMGEERINQVTPSHVQFVEWQRSKVGLQEFWTYANRILREPLSMDDVQDVWKCIEMTLISRQRKPFAFSDYLSIAMSSKVECSSCGRRPPLVTLDIDHILPVSRGGTNVSHNLRFLCSGCNRSRGNRFRWADIWRKG